MTDRIATLKLEHGQFKVAGPPDLVASIEDLQRVYGLLSPQLIATEMSRWYVLCSATGELIALTGLKYWSVEKQECYRDAEAALSAQTSRP